LGFEKEQVLVLKTPKFDELNVTVLKNRLQQLTGVSHVSAAVGTPFGGGVLSTLKVGEQLHKLSEFIVDEDYVGALGLNLLQGRDFVASDSNRVIVNETMVETMAWDQALGQKIRGVLGNDLEVIGVVMDFHLNDTHAPVHPVMITLGKQYTSNLLARLDTRDLAYTLGQVSDQWKQVEPNHPLEYYFLDEQFDELYKSEIQFKDLSGVFSGIAVLIACLGLYGFIAFSVQQRIKEIGIRKVMGAPVAGIVMLLSSDFLKLIGIAFVVATPIAWLLMHHWLEDFAYRIDLDWWMFAVAGLAAVGIALITVSFQAIKAALMNPVESLRSE
jgi:putative ABC transport system permease protein